MLFNSLQCVNSMLRPFSPENFISKTDSIETNLTNPRKWKAVYEHICALEHYSSNDFEKHALFSHSDDFDSMISRCSDIWTCLMKNKSRNIKYGSLEVHITILGDEAKR